MLTIPAAGVRVASQLEDAESLTNKTIAAFAEIKKTMMAIRTETGVAQYAGQDSLMRLQEGEAQLVKAMSNLMRVHQGLRREFITETDGLDLPGRCPSTGIGSSGEISRSA